MLFTASLPARPTNPLLRALFAIVGVVMLGLLIVFGFVALLVLLGVGAVALLVGALKRNQSGRKSRDRDVIEGEFVVLDPETSKTDHVRIR